MSTYCGKHGRFEADTSGQCPQCKWASQPPVAAIEPPWQDIEIVVAAASVLFETIEDAAPEKDSAIANVEAWLRSRGGAPGQ